VGDPSKYIPLIVREVTKPMAMHRKNCQTVQWWRQ